MRNPFKKHEFSESEIGAFERATEGRPRFEKSPLYEIPALEASTERTIIRPPVPLSRIDEIGLELKEIEAKKKMMEIEKGLHHLMEEIHPSKRVAVTKKLKEVLGSVRSSPESRAKRREGIKKGIGEVVKFLKESKAKREGTSAGTSEFRIPTKYYENVLGRGWLSPEKEGTKHKKHHHKEHKYKHHRHKERLSMEERMMLRSISRARRRMPWEGY